MADIIFHSGEIKVIPRNTLTPTPLDLLTVQETSFDFKGDIKKLMGEGQYAYDAAVGTTEITLKCKNGQLNPKTFNDVFFGKTITQNGESYVKGEEITVAAAAATLTGGANTLQDLGIFNKNTGTQYTRVASAPAAGQYVWGAAGALTFNASENTQVLLASYIKTDTATMQSTIATNELAGTTITIEAFFHKKFRDGRQFNLHFYNIIIPSLSFAYKLNDYTMPEFTMEAFADPVKGVFRTSWTK
jgi:hypothetical protein